MGVNIGSGRPTGPPELRRSESVRVMLRPGEKADLETVAEGWGVPPATAAWAIVSEQLAKWRHEQPELGAVGVARAAASHTLLKAGMPQVEPSE